MVLPIRRLTIPAAAFGDLLAGDHRCSAVVVVEAGGTAARAMAEDVVVALQVTASSAANGSLIGCVGCCGPMGVAGWNCDVLQACLRAEAIALAAGHR